MPGDPDFGGVRGARFRGEDEAGFGFHESAAAQHAWFAADRGPDAAANEG
jgi:hypothetical protein